MENLQGLSAEKLRELLQEQRDRATRAEERASELNYKAKEERRKAEDERHKAEEERSRATRAEERASGLEEAQRKTTLSEYIEACHHLFAAFAVVQDKRLTSQGSITNPRNKRCPVWIKPWRSFLEEQAAVFERLSETYPVQRHVFESRNTLRGLAERLSIQKIANEKSLEFFQHLGIEQPVALIIDHLAKEPAARNEFGIGDKLVFDNHPNAISDQADEVRQHVAQAPPATPGARPNLTKLRPDQICVYSQDGGDGHDDVRRMAYVVEYKAPHKLTALHLRTGLSEMREIDVFREVVNRAEVPTNTDLEALFAYHADRLATAAIAQTFHYMIEGGLEYSLLTTGESIVFLRIDWADPTVVYYHLAEPGPQVERDSDPLYSSAFGMTLAFSLMALSSQQRDQDVRQAPQVPNWNVNWEEVLRSAYSTPENRRSPPARSFTARTYKPPGRLRLDDKNQRIVTRSMADRPDGVAARRNRSPEPSDDEPEISSSPSPALPKRPGKTNQQSGRGGGQASSSCRSDRDRRQYCTQRCLLGLVQGEMLDERCPNVALHSRLAPAHHPINHGEWLRLLQEQLKRTLVEGITPLGIQGAHGVLFQITLLSHGYTFVAKGTVPEFVDALEHEAAVYKRLQPLQGFCVPVFLGSFDLRHISRTYYYDFRVCIVHLTFLSWAGDRLEMTEANASIRLRRPVVESLGRLHQFGVAHADVRLANTLWNRETGRVMIIDFERAVLIQEHGPVPTQPVPNKRTRTSRMTWRPFKTENQPIACLHPVMQKDLQIVNMVFRT